MRAYFKVEYVYDIPQNGNQKHGPLLEVRVGLFAKIGDEKKSRLLTDDEARQWKKMPKKRDGDQDMKAFDIALSMLLEDRKHEIHPPKQVPKLKYDNHTKSMIPVTDADGNVVLCDEVYHEQWNTTRFMELCMDRAGWSVSETQKWLYENQIQLLKDLQDTLDDLNLKHKITVVPMSEDVPERYTRIRIKKSRKSLMRELASTRAHRKGLI